MRWYGTLHQFSLSGLGFLSLQEVCDSLDQDSLFAVMKEVGEALKVFNGRDSELGSGEAYVLDGYKGAVFALSLARSNMYVIIGPQ